jgi:hypothetical protein
LLDIPSHGMSEMAIFRQLTFLLRFFNPRQLP